MFDCRSLAYVCMHEWGRGRTNEVSSVEKPLNEIDLVTKVVQHPLLDPVNQ